jgi:hypothetical protein
MVDSDYQEGGYAGPSFSNRDAIRGPGPFDTTDRQIRWWSIGILVIIAASAVVGWWASDLVTSEQTTSVTKQTDGYNASDAQGAPNRNEFIFRILKDRLAEGALLCIGFAGFAALLYWYDRRSMQQAVAETKGNSHAR